ncbi:putative methyltransferase [Chlorella vulgaris]
MPPPPATHCSSSVVLARQTPPNNPVSAAARIAAARTAERSPTISAASRLAATPLTGELTTSVEPAAPAVVPAVPPHEQPQRTFAPKVCWEPEVQGVLEAALGAEKLAEISAALARPPLATCLRVNTMRTTVEDLLRRLPEAMTPEDAALLEANPAYQHPLLAGAVILPGTGPHPIDYACTGGREVIVGRKAGEAVMRGAHVFVPGLQAVSQGILAGDLVAVSIGLELPGSQRYAFTRGTVLGTENAARQVEKLGAAAHDRSHLFIGIGRAELNRTEFFQERGGVGITMLERVFRTPGCGGLLPGDFMLQNVCSLVTAQVLGPPPGARVLDMCAAPGGKTTAIAQLMNNQGEVIAFDRTHAKAAGVRRIAESFGLSIVKAYKMDATKALLEPPAAAAEPAVAVGAGAAGAAAAGAEAGEGAGEPAAAAAPVKLGRRGGVSLPPSATTLRRLERVAQARELRGQAPISSALVAAGQEAVTPGFPPASFDYVLCDAPCTALGLRPRLLHRQSLRELEQTATYQRKLLRVAVALLKPGGHLVFSTCTINPGENEGNVRWLLDTFPDMRLIPQSPRLGLPGLSGTVTLPDGSLQQLLSESEAALVQRFDPSAPLDTIGFFIAKFEKAAAA